MKNGLNIRQTQNLINVNFKPQSVNMLKVDK